MLKVAIIGKPNVGKSTLFNRMLGQKKAIVYDAAGTTRDRNYALCHWLDKDFMLIDTGGYSVNKLSSDAELQHLINMQVQFAMNEADVLLYVVDEQRQIDQDDMLIVKQLRSNKKPIILVVNKAENVINNQIYNSNWKKLGLSDPIYVSADHGLNIYQIFEQIAQVNVPQEEAKTNKFVFCILGKPNVGKSSLVNCILHENKMVVSDVSGTTRDAIDSTFTYDNEQYVIIDTTGLRQRGKLDELEKFSLLRSELALKRSQFAILIVDVSKPLTDQDKHVAQLIYDANMPCIIVANKIDLISHFNNAIRKDLENRFKEEFKFLPYAQYLFTSCINDDVNVKLLLKMMNDVNNQLQRKIDQRYLDQLINKVQVVNEPPLFKGGRVELLSIQQVNGRMPTFVINVNDVKYLHFSYMRYIENQIKTTFNFNLVPILVYYKDSKKKELSGHE